MNNPKSKFARRYSFSEYGHVERNEKMGVGFSSGRLGYLWSMVDGVALAHPDKSVLMSGSDGSQMEGDDEEAATRPAVPYILDEAGNKFFEPDRYTFQPGKDEVVRDGSDGFIVAVGDTLYRAIDASENLKEQGLKVGVLNKPTLNLIDEEALKKVGGSGFVLVAETQNQVTGLGIRYGTWLLERGYTPHFKHLGIAKPGEGGGLEQVGFHGLEPEHLIAAVKELAR
jgi:transketolase C-terminal domain/subunit